MDIFTLRILVYQWGFLFVFQNKLLEEGQEYAVMMYTWRCCSRALPQVGTHGGAVLEHYLR